MKHLDPARGLYKPHAWVFTYFLDWGACGKQVKHLRLYATALRWYDRGDRDQAVTHGELWIADKDRIQSKQLLTNLGDLMASDVELGPSIPAEPFHLFLGELRHGDLIAGGHVSDRVDPSITAALPGFAWTLDQWRKHFPRAPMPWPFWIWPKPDEPPPT